MDIMFKDQLVGHFFIYAIAMPRKVLFKKISETYARSMYTQLDEYVQQDILVTTVTFDQETLSQELLRKE